MVPWPWFTRDNKFERICLGKLCMHTFGRAFNKFHNTFELTFPIKRYLAKQDSGGFCFLFELILYVPSTAFQLNRDGSSWVEPVLS